MAILSMQQFGGFSCRSRSEKAHPMNSAKNLAFSLALIVISVALCLVGAEVILRVKNASMTNYDIEMWRYANDLKQTNPDPALGFDHVKSKSALLQNTEIRVNEWGLR